MSDVAVKLVAAIFAASLTLAVGTDSGQAGGTATQPGQPAKGPGGADYAHRDWWVTEGGTGNDAWYVFEPLKPRPKKAPLAVVMHGYSEFSGYETLRALIEHTVRKGNVVIYPRWQTGVAEPCPGPFDIEPCMASTVNAIRGALDYLRSDPQRVQPQLRRTSYFGFSFGGIITANLANRYRELGLPKPRAVFLDDPHDGGFTGTDEPALDDDLGGIPPKTLFQCHSGANGVFDDPAQSGNPANPLEPKSDGSCNSVFPKLTSIPAENKDLVLTYTDAHGNPPLSSDHGVCAGPSSGASAVNAYDWGFCWKVWDALRDCAYDEAHCNYALGDTRRHRRIGRWSDGVPITLLKIQDWAPIRP